MAGVTQDDVFAAADELVASDETPTVERVRQMVGGSNTTVVRHMKAWRERQRRQELPSIPDVPTPAIEAFQQFWSTAQETALALAHQAYEQRRQECQKASDAAQRDVASARAERDECLAHHAVLRERIEHIDAARRDAQDRVEALETELRESTHAAGVKLEALQSTLAETREQARETESRLTSELDARTDELAERTRERDQATERYESDSTLWLQRVESEVQHRNKCEKALKDAAEDAAEYRHTIDQANARVALLETQHSALSSALNAEKAAHDQCEERLATLAAAREKLEDRLEYAARVSARQTDQLLSELHAAQSQNKALIESLATQRQASVDESSAPDHSGSGQGA